MSREELTTLLTRLRDADAPELQNRLEAVLRSMEVLEDRLARVENSVLFRFNRAVGRTFETYKKKLGQRLLYSGWHSLFLRLSPPVDERYSLWVKQEEARLQSKEWHRAQSRLWTYHPCVSIVMPVHKPKREWLDAAIASVREQCYENWQLCLCDDASGEPWLADYLHELAVADSRIRFIESNQPLGIAAASNRAGMLADGDYVAFLDHDDVLPWHALHYVAEACQEPGVQIVYSDEDCLGLDGRRQRPRFKPDWSPELLTSCMYLGHLLVVERSLLEDARWFREGLDGAQDHDLALRLTDGGATVRHVSRVLYHWRQHEGSTAGNPTAKQYAHPAGRKALEDALVRRRIDGSVEDGETAGTFRVRRRVSGDTQRTGQEACPTTKNQQLADDLGQASRPVQAFFSTLPERVSVITCSRNQSMLERMIAKLDKTTDYRNFEVVLIEHRCGGVAFDLTQLRERLGSRLVHVPFTGPFHFAAMNNLGAKAANGSVLLFLNDDVEPLSSDWLGALVSQLQRDEVGAVGARLQYPSGAIQHAGIALGMMDGVGHPGRGLFRSDLFPWIDYTRNVSAVTGACLGIRRAVFEEMGGFDEIFDVNYNDVDLCLRLRERGYEIIYDASARLVHKESASRAGGTRLRERVNFYSRWLPLLEKTDPYLPVAIDRADEQIRLRLD